MDEDVIQYEDLMSWLSEADSMLQDVHKLHKYRQQDYLDHRAFKTELEHKKDLVTTHQNFVSMKENKNCQKIENKYKS